MTDTDIINFIIEQRVKVVPVMDHSRRVEHWSAGYILVDEHTRQHIVVPGNFVRAETFRSAVETLAKQRRIEIDDEPALIKAANAHAKACQG